MQNSKKLFANIKILLSIAYKQDPVLLWLYFVTTILGALFLFAVFFGFKLLIDAIAPTSTSPLFPAVIALITYLFFEYLSRFVYYTVNQYYVAYVFRSKTQNTLTIKLMEKVASLDLAQLEDGQTRNLIAKVFDTYTWTVVNMVATLNYVLYSSASIILALMIASRFNLMEFLFIALATVPLFYLRIKFGEADWSIYGSQSPKANLLWYMHGLFYDNHILTEMKLYGFSNYITNKMDSLQKEMLAAYQKPIFQYTVASVLLSLLIPISLFIPLYHYINIGTSGYSLGDYTLLLNALLSFSTQLSSLLVNAGSLNKDGLFLNDYITLLNLKSNLSLPKIPFKFKNIEPHTITFENVTFTYPDSTNPTLKDISFVIEKGKNVAIVGENGAGKTTLIKLLLRFYDPDKGRILIDGVDLKTLDIQEWYKHIGILFQQFGRYFFTLEENIALGDITKVSKKSDITAALQSAQAQDILEELPHGLKQILGKRFDEGQDLSTGQWQKVAIARALYRHAPYLILDEPTANIDAESEAKIFDNLIKKYKQRCLLFISHRFSTVRHADSIIVIHKGQIQSIGTHEELMKLNGLYTKYFTLQKKGYI